MRIKDTIKAAKKAIKLAEKNPMLYTDEEIIYMKRALRTAREDLKKKRDFMSKGFKNEAATWTSAISTSDTRSGSDDGLHSEGEQSSEPGES